MLLATGSTMGLAQMASATFQWWSPTPVVSATAMLLRVQSPASNSRALPCYAQKERCLYCDVLAQELNTQQRLVAENSDFAAFAPFASRFPFELCVLPKSHNSAFSRITDSEIGNLAHILRDILQKLDSTLGRLPYSLSLQDRPLVRPRKGYWRTIEADFHWHLEILPQVFRVTGFEWASGFFYNPVPPEIAARCLVSRSLD